VSCSSCRRIRPALARSRSRPDPDAERYLAEAGRDSDPKGIQAIHAQRTRSAASASWSRRRALRIPTRRRSRRMLKDLEGPDASPRQGRPAPGDGRGSHRRPKGSETYNQTLSENRAKGGQGLARLPWRAAGGHAGEGLGEAASGGAQREARRLRRPAGAPEKTGEWRSCSTSARSRAS